MGKHKKTKRILSFLLMLSLISGNVFNVNAVNTVDTEYDLVELDRGQTTSEQLITDGEKGGSAWTQGKDKSIASGVSYGEGTRSGMLPSNNGNSYIGQIVNVSPNTEYTLKTYIKTNAADAKVNLCIRGGTESQKQMLEMFYLMKNTVEQIGHLLKLHLIVEVIHLFLYHW